MNLLTRYCVGASGDTGHVLTKGERVMEEHDHGAALVVVDDDTTVVHTTERGVRREVRR
jgi:hypothetical protein